MRMRCRSEFDEFGLDRVELTDPLTRNTFSLLPMSFSSSLEVTFFSAASTIPRLGGPGYFLSRSALASSSFFFAAAVRTGAAAGVSPSTAIASTVVGSEVNGVADGPGARIPTTVPAWPGQRRQLRCDRARESMVNLLILSKAYSTWKRRPCGLNVVLHRDSRRQRVD